AAVAPDDVAGRAAGDVVVDRAAVDVLDVGDAAGAGGRPGGQVDRDAGGVRRVVERVGPAAAVDPAGDRLAGAELERVVGRAAGELLEAREGGDAGDGAGVGVGDVPGGRRVRADQGVGPALAVDHQAARGGPHDDRVVAGAGVQVDGLGGQRGDGEGVAA